MEIQFYRHATHAILYKNQRLLIDPMFSPAGTLAPVANAANDHRNPLVNLPVPPSAILERIDAVFVSHTHRDHFDDESVRLLPKEVPLFCQPIDKEKIVNQGFRNVNSIDTETSWQGIHVHRTTGQHGRGEVGTKMGQVSGFALSAPNEPTVYIAGDTIWCAEVKKALNEHRPDVIVLFAGAAQFLTGGAITMDTSDIAEVAAHAPKAQIVVLHLEAWNHCLLSRKDLQKFLETNRLANRVCIPKDGERLRLG